MLTFGAVEGDRDQGQGAIGLRARSSSFAHRGPPFCCYLLSTLPEGSPAKFATLVFFRWASVLPPRCRMREPPAGVGFSPLPLAPRRMVSRLIPVIVSQPCDPAATILLCQETDHESSASFIQTDHEAIESPMLLCNPAVGIKLTFRTKTARKRSQRSAVHSKTSSLARGPGQRPL